jgi:hypothetical protein
MLQELGGTIFSVRSIDISVEISIDMRIDLFTSAMVIILAELCPAVLANLAPQTLDASWQKCQHALELMSSYNRAAQKCGQTLNAMRQRAAPVISSKLVNNPHASRPYRYELDEQEGPSRPSEPHAFPMETYPTLSEEVGGGNYQRDQLGSRSGARSPANSNPHDNMQLDDGQLWDVLWHDTGSIPTWNIEEWGWWNEGMMA